MSAIVASSSSRKISAAERPLVPHAHIEGRVEAQREAARGFIELHRRNADVEHNSVDRVDAEAPHDLVELAKARFHKLQPTAGRSLERFAGPDRRGVAIERDHTRAAFEKRARIAPAAERAIDIEAASARIELFHRLVKQNRNMAGPSGRGGAHPGAPGGACASRSARKRRTRSRACSRWA